jgi:hypothetical protein
METIKDLAYWKNNCEENYLTTPISVLRYITELEKSIQLMQTAVVGECVIHNTDWNGKCFKCNEQVFTRDPK